VTKNRTIAVIGITGSQGGAVARHLLKQEWALRGLTRDGSRPKARALADRGVEIVEGEMGDSAVLDRLFAGVSGVFALTDFFHNGLVKEVAQGRAIVDAAVRAGVKHFVYPSLALSERHTGVPYFEAKVAIEQHIRAAALPATILRLAMFMEDLTEKKYAPPVWWGTVRRTVGGAKRLMWVAVDDVGAVTARVFADPDRFIGQTLTVAGDYLSIDEARALFLRIRGKAPLAIPLPLWLCRRVINADLVPFWLWLGRNAVENDVDAARSVNPAMQSMEQWLRAATPVATA
jgi:uncharacterized protein YbjT (DUF2867 family)